MSIQDLTNLKTSYKGGHFYRSILNTLVDEIVALDARNEALNAKIDTLESQMANRMLCTKYKAP